MKKLVAIIGSNNEHTLTGQIVQTVAEQLFKRKIVDEYDLIFLKEYQINYCIGCGKCFRTGSCSLDKLDDMEKIRLKLLDSDILVIASPVYFVNVPGKLKSVIDRLSRDIHLLRYAGRYGFTITVTNSSGAENVSEYLKLIQLSLGISNLNNYCYVNMIENKESFCEQVIDDMILKLKVQSTFSQYYLEKLLIKCKKIYTNQKNDTAETIFWKQEWVKKTSCFQNFAIQNRLRDNRTSYIENGIKVDEIFLTTNIKAACGFELIQPIQDYLKRVFQKFFSGQINPLQHAHFLILICECCDIFVDKEYWKAVGYNLCKDIKDEIEINGIKGKLGIWSGLGIKAFAVNEYCCRFKELKQFNKAISDVLIEELENRCKIYLEKKEKIDIRQYDVCFGVSGILYFLLDSLHDSELKVLNYTIKYLIWVSMEDEERKKPNFLIDVTGQLNEEDREKYPQGSINLGMAHGLIGILVVLCKAKSKGINYVGIDKAIKNLFELYERQCVLIDGIPYWKPQLSYDEWKENIRVDKKSIERASWCYGNVGIARGLQKASHYIGDWKREEKYGKMVKSLVKQSVYKLGLESPMICHGYSGVLMLMICEYKQYDDKEYLVNINEVIKQILSSSLKSDGEIEMKVFEEDDSILQGLMGVALALKSVLTVNTHYEKLFLMD